MTHILWDWNGTLLDDTQAAVDTLNIMLERRGGRPVTMDFYRDHFAFPVRPFYEAIGVCLENEDWDALAREYHDVYAARPKRLNAEAIAALERVKAAGARQSIISALRQDLLEEITARLGVAKYMDRICGVDNLYGFGKIDRAREMLRDIQSGSAIHPQHDSFILIGDSPMTRRSRTRLARDASSAGRGATRRGDSRRLLRSRQRFPRPCAWPSQLQMYEHRPPDAGLRPRQRRSLVCRLSRSDIFSRSDI